jgi:hypothetical protein
MVDIAAYILSIISAKGSLSLRRVFIDNTVTFEAK